MKKYILRLKHILIIVLLGFAGVLNAQTPDFTGFKVCIDPGHGGHESDDRGPFEGFWESESNLTKGLWLRDLLEARGATVFITRTGNDGILDDPSLSERKALANNNNVHLFISIHSNAGTQSVSYPMTIFNGYTNNPVIPDAKVWAQILWEHLKSNEATHFTSQGYIIGDLTLNPSWNYGYGVLYGNLTPSIISEGSMHDYKPELHRLLSLDYRKAEAYQMLYAMEEYFELTGEEPYGNISGLVRDSLLVKDNMPVSPDKYNVVSGTRVELQETGEFYYIDSIEIDPLAEVKNTGFYMFDSLVPGTYHLIFSEEKYYTDTVEVIVNAHSFTYHNNWQRADKSMAPSIISHSPADGETIKCNDPIQFAFSMNMDAASFDTAFSIIPETEGTFSWDENYLNGSFQPDMPYEVNTEYTVFVDTTAVHQWGVYLDTSLTFSFTTDDRNRYLLDSSFPAEGQSDINPFLQFRLIFEAPINNTSLIYAVSIVKEDGGEIFTKGAEISTIEGKGHYYFESNEELEYNTNYTLQLLGSIKDVDNIPLVDTVKIPFTTGEDPGVLTVLDEFDNINNWSINTGESIGLDGSSFLYRWTKTFRSGSASMLVRYKFNAGDASCVIDPSAPIGLASDLDDIGMWVWGEMSDNYISIGFDNGTEVRLDTIDFAGWNYLKADIPDGATAISYYKIERISAMGADGGDLLFDAMSQPGVTAIQGVRQALDILVFPNPVSGTELKINGLPDGESIYKIYSISGYKMQEGIINHGSSSIQLNKNVKDQSVFILNITNSQKSISLILTNWPD